MQHKHASLVMYDWEPAPAIKPRGPGDPGSLGDR